LIWRRIFDLHVLAVALLALAATWACLRLDVRADLPSELIAIAVVFPTAFGIAAAHRRREQALEALANLRGVLASIYYAHRDWSAPTDQPSAKRAGALVRRFGAALARALRSPPLDRAAARAEVARGFSDMSASIEALKTLGVSGSETSRAQQFLNHGVREFERLRAIADYRTADSLRAYSKVFLNVLPVLFAPYYAHVAAEAGHALFGYGVALAFALVLVGLDNVQDGLENPFDGLGVDDVRLDAAGDLAFLEDDAGGQAFADDPASAIASPLDKAARTAT